MYVEARKGLVNWLRRQLIGPAHEGSLRVSPLDRYPIGVLHPIDPEASGVDPASSSQEEADPSLLDELEDAPFGNDGPEEEPLARPAPPPPVRTTVGGRFLLLRSRQCASCGHGFRGHLCRNRGAWRTGSFRDSRVRPDSASGAHRHMVECRKSRQFRGDDLEGARRNRHSRTITWKRPHSHHHPVQSG